MWWRWPFGFKGQFAMGDDPVDCLQLFDKREDSRLSSALRIGLQRVQKKSAPVDFPPLIFFNFPETFFTPAASNPLKFEFFEVLC